MTQLFNSLKSILLIMLLMMVWCGCNKKVAVPAYININQLDITSNYLSQGSTAANITDVWVYVNGKLQGIYPLPCSFPVLDMGSASITIRPGIKKNGLSGDRINYPFYGSYDTTLVIEAEKVYTVSPRVPYRDAMKMEYFEDFENGGYRLRKTTLNNADTFVITNDPAEVFERKYSGKCVIAQNKNMEYVMTDSYYLLGSGNETYIELNYKSEADILVGFYQTAGSIVERYPVVSLYKTDKWKKAYISITNEVSSQLIKYAGSGSTFAVFFQAQNVEASPKTVLLDNIKLVRF